MRPCASPVALAAAVAAVAACSSTELVAVPTCSQTERLALVAQSVRTAAYLPCLAELPDGWRATRFEASTGASTFWLQPDRGADGRPVRVRLRRHCDLDGSTPESPRAEGVRSAVRLHAVSPSYRGTRLDDFPGGCVETSFDLDRGPHVPLLEELGAAVDLVRRRELELRLRDELGVELDP